MRHLRGGLRRGPGLGGRVPGARGGGCRGRSVSVPQRCTPLRRAARYDRPLTPRLRLQAARLRGVGDVRVPEDPLAHALGLGAVDLVAHLLGPVGHPEGEVLQPRDHPRAGVLDQLVEVDQGLLDDLLRLRLGLGDAVDCPGPSGTGRRGAPCSRRCARCGTSWATESGVKAAMPNTGPRRRRQWARAGAARRPRRSRSTPAPRPSGPGSAWCRGGRPDDGCSRTGCRRRRPGGLVGDVDVVVAHHRVGEVREAAVARCRAARRASG